MPDPNKMKRPAPKPHTISKLGTSSVYKANSLTAAASWNEFERAHNVHRPSYYRADAFPKAIPRSFKGFAVKFEHEVLISLAGGLLLLSPLSHGFHSRTDSVLKFLPWRPVELVTELPIVVHLAPAISSPFTPCHIDDKVPIFLGVVDVGIRPVFATSPRRKAIDLPLRNERRMRSDPRVIDIKVFQRILFFVFPLHVFLLVVYGIPPNVEETICPCTSADKERAEIEASAILRDDNVHRRSLVVAGWGSSNRVEMCISEGVGNI